MEPLLPQFPWEVPQRIATLPEAQLIYAIIVSAWTDATGKRKSSHRKMARVWLFSNQFATFCDFLDLPCDAIREHLFKSIIHKEKRNEKSYR